MMKNVTADQIAELAGVSRSAVSRSFSTTASVSAKTRRKVLEASRKLGYRPNGMASNLARQTSDIVALINDDTPDFRELYFHQALSKAIVNLGKTPVMISLGNDDSGGTSLEKFITFPLYTAIVSADSVEAANVISYCKHAPPIMLNGNFRQRDLVDAVQLDEKKGFSEFIDHLQTLGRSNIWLISGRLTATAHRSRKMSLLEALARSDIRLVDDEDSDFTYEGGKAAFNKLKNRGPVPDILFCANDLMAMGAMDAARYEHGLRAPEDIFIAGFDDIPQASWPTYRLPSIQQDEVAIIECIKSIFCERGQLIDGEQIIKTVTTRFVPR